MPPLSIVTFYIIVAISLFILFTFIDIYFVFKDIIKKVKGPCEKGII